jgi:hypothetical protein
VVPRIWPDPGSATSVVNDISLLIDHQCPQCGAPAVLSETDRLFHCDFCKVNSYLVEHSYFRYLLPHKAPPDRQLVYFPYWRFKGMLFSCLHSGIEHRFLDISRQAVQAPLFPPSVGLRSQALKLRFVSPETQGWFIKPALPFRRVMETFLTNINREMPQPVFHQSQVGESLSLIYAPFYIDDKIVDAVLNQPVSADLDAAFDLRRFAGGPADWRIRFIPTLCPNCGWDLQGSKDALVLHCQNCASMWQASKDGLTRLTVAHMASPEETNVVYLPFWRIKADVSGIELGNYADLVKAANLPKVVRPEWRRLPYYFWGPAFKVRPRTFLRLTHQITLCQPRDQLAPDVPRGTMHPVNLPVSESAETMKLNLAGWIRPKKAVEDHIAEIKVSPRRFLLVYLPFEVRQQDLVQSAFQVAVNRNQLALAGNL